MVCRFKEAVNECTSALDAIPSYHKALVRRAKAYEQMGHFKQALSDIQKANKADTANPEMQVRFYEHGLCLIKAAALHLLGAA